MEGKGCGEDMCLSGSGSWKGTLKRERGRCDGEGWRGRDDVGQTCQHDIGKDACGTTGYAINKNQSKLNFTAHTLPLSQNSFP